MLRPFLSYLSILIGVRTMKVANLMIAFSVSALSACSGSSSEAGKAVFEETINRYEAQRGVCLPVKLDVNDGLQTLLGNNLVGSDEIRILYTDSLGNKVNQQALRQMDLLEEGGFYQRVEDNFAKPQRQSEVKVKVFQITDKGRSQTKLSPQGPKFCIGRLKVDEVKWYTEPAAGSGMIMSKVAYQATFVPERWAKRLLKEDEKVWREAAKPSVLKATLVKTNEGWRDIRELN